MGIPAPGGGANAAPPAGDKANAVISGSFKATGVSAAFAFYGSFNVVMWGSAVTTLTTVAGSLAATVASAAGLAVGQGINSVNVPAGTTIATIAGLNITLNLPPGAVAAQVVGGADAAAIFNNVQWDATIQLERSFDGGVTWIICGVGGAGQQAIYADLTAVSIVVGEPELSVLYRLNCTEWTAGTINYRMSASGLLAMVFGVPPS